jgi:DNA-binding NarL/FixJ family response regulator
MKQPIGILIVDDTSSFVVQITRQLRRARLSFRARRIASKDEFVHALQCHRPDLILSNGGLPSFDGLTALAVATEKRPDVPFIFVTLAADERSLSASHSPGARQGWLRCSLPELARTVRQALREAKVRTRLRDVELRVLTSRWMAR